jgi:hypothetical protein
MIAMIRPLWMTNWERTADRLYESLPCQRINLRKYWNSFIEKSEAKDAYLPSLPTIPTPTFASKIMPTSLPPSPIAQVLLPVIYEIFLVIVAFWVGEHLQTQTLGDLVASMKNLSSSFLFDKKKSKDVPSIIRITLLAFLEYSSSRYWASKESAISRIKKIYSDLFLNPAEIAIQVAVSILSPVSIQTWIPAFLRLSITTATLS